MLDVILAQEWSFQVRFRHFCGEQAWARYSGGLFRCFASECAGIHCGVSRSARLGLLPVLFHWAVLVIVGSTLSGCGSGAEGQTSVPSPPPPSAIVCRELVWDFGTVDSIETPSVEHVFRIQNTADVPVAVEDVSTTCGCVVPKDHPTEIPAGSIAEFPVKVQTVGRPGPFQKSVEIRLRTSPPSSLRPSIVGIIAANSGFYTVPSIIHFGRVQPGEPKRQSVKLMRYDGTRVEVLEVSPLHPAVRLSKMTPLDDAHSVVELEFELDADTLPPGAFESQVVGRTEHARRESFKIPLRASITDSSPELLDKIIVPQLSPGETAVRPLLRPGGRTIDIRELTYEGPDFLNVELINGDDFEPLLKVQRTDEPSSEKLVRGRLQVRLGPQKKKSGNSADCDSCRSCKSVSGSRKR